ncbi:MAG TPA: alpha/beta fold hydrolase [Propionibacteriaceae bacterium]|nr:alpha/beta fold hydrolase [Propionibacteriaceae bacterium]
MASGFVIEAAWATAHAVMYPLGLLSAPTRIPNGRRHQDLSNLKPEQRGLVHHDVDAAETPILLVHGIIDNHAIFTVMERALRRRGFQTLSAYDYGLLTHSIPRAAVRLGEAIARLSAATGYERIHVIGHSLGGLIARYYVQRLAGDRHVHTLVTLGTPHQGTQLAWSAPLLPLVRQLTPNSSVMQELAEPAPGCRTRFVAFYSDIDHLIVPSRNARLDHPDLNVRNIAARGVGHLSMANNGRIAFTIAGTLRQLDYDGVPAPHNA